MELCIQGIFGCVERESEIGRPNRSSPPSVGTEGNGILAKTKKNINFFLPFIELSTWERSDQILSIQLARMIRLQFVCKVVKT